MKTEQTEPKHFWKWFIAAIGIILLLAALVAAAWYFFHAKREIKPHQQAVSATKRPLSALAPACSMLPLLFRLGAYVAGKRQAPQFAIIVIRLPH
jgi:TRAP-type C4-dicarboxylate transport system permease large subunit